MELNIKDKDSFAENFRRQLCDRVLYSTCALKTTVYSKIKSIFPYLTITFNDNDEMQVYFGCWFGQMITYKYRLRWTISQNNKFHHLAGIDTIIE